MGVPASNWGRVDQFLAKVQTLLDDVHKTNTAAADLLVESASGTAPESVS